MGRGRGGGRPEAGGGAGPARACRRSLTRCLTRTRLPASPPPSLPPATPDWNKVQHLMHVHLQNEFAFVVHPRAFVVHVPHPQPSTKWLTRRSGQKDVNHRMFLEALELMQERRFVPVTSFPELCVPASVRATFESDRRLAPGGAAGDAAAAALIAQPRLPSRRGGRGMGPEAEDSRRQQQQQQQAPLAALKPQLESASGVEPRPAKQQQQQATAASDGATTAEAAGVQLERPGSAAAGQARSAAA